MKMLFLNAEKDMTWVATAAGITIEPRNLALLVCSNVEANSIEIRLYYKRDPIDLDKPNETITLNGHPASQLHIVLGQQFPNYK